MVSGGIGKGKLAGGRCYAEGGEGAIV